MSHDTSGQSGRSSLTISTSDGFELEAELAIPEDVEAVVVACHPHPLYGGSMHANVVQALFEALPEVNVAVLRFNFRGSGGSTGSHDEGRSERLDVMAALDHSTTRWPDTPLLLAGYSFGADVSLAVDHPAIVGWLAIAPPLRVVPMEEMAALSDERPKTIVGAAHDQFNPYEALVETMAQVPNSTVIEAQGADHFFGVGLDTVVTAAKAALGLEN